MNGLPEVIARHVDGGRLELQLDVATDCPWFVGHFPGQPILPGVVQIGWASHFAAELIEHDTPPAVLDRIKFKRPIGPGARLTLRLERAGDKVSYEYLLAEAGTAITASSGVLNYAIET